MLVTKNVILKWSPRNKTYFINKGYKFSEYNKEFIVSVIDLTRKNNSIVEYMCDQCLKIISTTYDNCMNNFDKNGFHRCKSCASQESGSKRKVDESSILNEFKIRNLTLLDNLSNYKNDRTRLKFRCNIHNSLVQ
jgi:hypothetical protein